MEDWPQGPEMQEYIKEKWNATKVTEAAGALPAELSGGGVSWASTKRQGGEENLR